MALPRTPTRDKKEKQEKLTAMGYLSYLSPKSPCRNSDRPQFELHLQNDKDSVMKARGFGDDNYRKLLPYMQDKSPVKMQLFRSEKFPTPTCGINSNIKRAIRMKYHSLGMKSYNLLTNLVQVVPKYL